MLQDSYWLSTSRPFSRGTAGDVSGKVDVAVVGAGLTGLSTAYHLARQGASVAVLEAHSVGWGASGRNGGMATTGLAISFGAAITRFGLERAIAMRQRYNDAIDLIESIADEAGIDAEIRRCGLLNLAARRSHVDHYRREADLISTHTPYPARFLDAGSLRDEIGSEVYHGGMVDPAGVSLHPGKFVVGLADAAADAGAAVFERAAVTGLTRRQGSHRLTTARGTIKADQVVVATGAYSRRPFGWLQRRLAPVGSFVIVTEPLGDLVDRLLPRRRVCSDSKALLNYFRATEDGRLVFGGRARFMSRDVSSDARSGEILRQELATVFPELAGARVEYMWGGLVDITMDRMVHSGVRDGWHFAAGYSGHGVQMATYMGKVLAGTIGGEPDDPWRDLPNPPIPGHLGWPWFVPVAGVYYTVRDRLTR